MNAFVFETVLGKSEEEYNSVERFFAGINYFISYHCFHLLQGRKHVINYYRRKIKQSFNKQLKKRFQLYKKHEHLKEVMYDELRRAKFQQYKEYSDNYNFIDSSFRILGKDRRRR